MVMTNVFKTLSGYLDDTETLSYHWMDIVKRTQDQGL